MRRVLLDQGLPPETAALLRQAGWDAVHVREIGMSRAADPEILAQAVLENRVCVTLDKDFHDVLASCGAEKPSVVLIRRQRLRAKDVSELLAVVWTSRAAELAAGAAVTVSEKAVRVRSLPLRPGRS